jgi:hypothetical protein
MQENAFQRYMRLVDELERTALEYNAPREMIGDIPAFAALYFDRLNEGSRTTRMVN